MGVYTRNSIVTNGLVLQLDAANRKSYPSTGITWTDLSGRNNNGTLLGSSGALPIYSDLNGGCFSFPGANSPYIDCGNSSIIQTNNTISVFTWFTINQNLAVYPIVSKGNTVSSTGWEIVTTSGVFRCKVNPGASISATGTLSLNTWYYGGFTVSGTTLNIYLNGTLNASGSISTPAANTTDNLWVGARTVLTTRQQGNIALVQMYNRTLSATEVLQNYNTLKTRFNLS